MYTKKCPDYEFLFIYHLNLHKFETIEEFHVYWNFRDQILACIIHITISSNWFILRNLKVLIIFLHDCNLYTFYPFVCIGILKMHVLNLYERRLAEHTSYHYLKCLINIFECNDILTFSEILCYIYVMHERTMFCLINKIN